MRRLACLLLVLALLPLGWPSGASGQGAPRLRALLVGADRFSSHPDTAPAARNNLQHLASALRCDVRGYERIRLSLNEALDDEAFKALAASSYSGAKAGDVSLFYISTHGFYDTDQDPMTFSMLLSDGDSEYYLTARELHAALAPVPGLKVLIIDTCFSGALIDRGLPGEGLRSLFTNADFKVITASGGSEPSFLWSTGSGDIRGGSYFADTLAAGVSGEGGYAADRNRDGTITLAEAHDHLMGNYAAATAQVYPAQDDMPLLVYDRKAAGSPTMQVSSLLLDQSVFSAGEEELSFSFTLNHPARLAYQLMYQKSQQWQFSQAQVIADLEQPNGESLPGRKERRLRIRLDDEATSGYVLLFLTTVLEDSSTPQAQALLMVEPSAGDPELGLRAAPSFSPGEGQEMALQISHRFPLRLTVTVCDLAGALVSTLAEALPTRPTHLPGGGSVFYWPGRAADGSLLPPGTYHARVSARIGGIDYHASSAPFTLH
ncbi:MAG: caspase family protein [Christensenellales bacterium]